LADKGTGTLKLNPCNLCPRECGADRESAFGFCGYGNEIKAARAAPHFWEEPCISGSSGSGAVFFSGCPLKCCYCQNFEISCKGYGREITAERLAEIFLELQDRGVHNINLVTAAQYLTGVIKALDIARPGLHIPVVYNSSGYERAEAVKALKGYVDIYLPDIKYFSPEISQDYSKAKDYFNIASAAVKEMVRQTGTVGYDKQGVMQKGVIIRHMVLPGAREDSIRILKWMSGSLPKDKFLLSLMSQYTPMFRAEEYGGINRRVTTFEYESVVKEALRLGLDNGFIQRRSSAKSGYTPVFDFEGV
jgi:putative pyruvate formate lyase activating enzyme